MRELYIHHSFSFSFADRFSDGYIVILLSFLANNSFWPEMKFLFTDRVDALNNLVINN